MFRWSRRNLQGGGFSLGVVGRYKHSSINRLHSDHSRESRTTYPKKMKFTMLIAMLIVIPFASAEDESSEDLRPNKTSFLGDKNDLSPFEGSQHPTLLTDWVKVKTKEVKKEIHIVEGQTLSLTCEVSSSRMPQVGWYKGNLRVTEEIEEENDISPLGVVQIVQRFVAPCASLLHSGVYYCKGSSRGAKDESGVTNVIVHRTRPGTKLGSCKLTKGKARLTLFTPIMMQVIGTDIIIPCRAAGLPTPTITWTKDNQSIKENRIQVLENGDLYISKLRWLDMGNYKCLASNQFGTDSHMTFLYPLLKEK